MKQIINGAVKFSPTVENVIVARNASSEVSIDSIRDHWCDELCKLPIAKGKGEFVQVDLRIHCSSPAPLGPPAN